MITIITMMIPIMAIKSNNNNNNDDDDDYGVLSHT